MKTTKLFLLLLSAAALALCGCGKDNSKSKEEVKPCYSIGVTDDGNGTAAATVGGVAVSAAEQGATVTLTATPKAGYYFVKWTIEGGDITLSPDATSSPATFTMPAAQVSVKAEFVEVAVEINGIVWAQYNVDAPGRFTARPEDSGCFYQWNRKKPWPVTGDVTDWDTTLPSGDSWEQANDPCPEGWRVPTKEELTTLLDATKIIFQKNTVNGIPGDLVIDRTSGNTIFLPAIGSRDPTGATDAYGIGYYWSSTPSTADEAWRRSNNHTLYASPRTYGFLVRCVQK